MVDPEGGGGVKGVEVRESVVAQWLAHLPLVPEVSDSIPARDENVGVRTHYL